MDWKAVLATVAPTLATAVGGPLAGAAVQAIGKALGLPNATQETIEQTVLGASPETLLALRQAEQEFTKAMRALDIDLEKVHAGDRDSARKREASTGDKATPRTLAFIVVIGFLATVLSLLLVTKVTDPTTASMIGTLIGYVSAKADQVISYYFGSSAGSARKDELLRNAAK